MIEVGYKGILYRYTEWLWIFDENNKVVKFKGGDHFDFSNTHMSWESALDILFVVFGVSYKFNRKESGSGKIVIDFIEAKKED